jgi:6-phosphogluconolactonase
MAALTVAADEQALARAAAERTTAVIERAIAQRGGAMVSLAGGSTPRRTYALLADEAHAWRARIAWRHVHLFWGDERHVPPDHQESNFGMANGELVRHVPIPRTQVHRMRGEMPDARDAACDYERRLSEAFAAAGRTDRTFDLMLLGMGEDAHIASIFPESELLERRPVKGRPRRGDDAGRPVMGRPDEGDRVAAVWAPHLDAWRITLTPAALLDSRTIVLLAAGHAKAAAVRAARDGPLDVSRWPAQLLREAGDRVEWIIDRAASGG